MKVMRKICLTFIFLSVVTVFTKAQETTFKPNKGTFSTEVMLTPLSEKPIQLNQIKFRGFVSEKSVFRMAFLISGTIQDDKNRVGTPDKIQKAFEFSFKPGYEQHFAGTKRLSPYVGFEMDLGYKVSESEVEESGFSYTIEGAWDDQGTERAFTRLGMNVICGFDFYIAKNLYLGSEFGYGYQLQNFDKITYKRNDRLAGTTVLDEADTNYLFGPYVQNSIRLGFNF